MTCIQCDWTKLKLAFQLSKKSNCKQKLVAFITKGRHKIMYKGFNTSLRTQFMMKEIRCCQHAEMNVATQFINRFIRKNYNKKKNKTKKSLYNLNQYIIWVFRISSSKDIKLAKPCNICCHTLRKLGFRKVIYTTNEQTMIQQDLRYINNQHKSSSQTITELYSKTNKFLYYNYD